MYKWVKKLRYIINNKHKFLTCHVVISNYNGSVSLNSTLMRSINSHFLNILLIDLKNLGRIFEIHNLK